MLYQYVKEHIAAEESDRLSNATRTPLPSSSCMISGGVKIAGYKGDYFPLAGHDSAMNGTQRVTMHLFFRDDSYGHQAAQFRGSRIVHNSDED